MADLNLKKTKVKWIKSLFALFTMFLFMGNEGCENLEKRKNGRVLKRSAALLGIQARRIQLGSKVNIDLQGILNDQLLTEVNNTDYFVSINRFLAPMALSSKMSVYNRRKENPEKFRRLASNKRSAVCTKDLPDVLLHGTASDFELATSGGLSIGLGGLTGGLLTGLSFDVTRMIMSLDMHAYEPLTLSHTGASVSRKGVKTDFAGGIKVNLGAITLNPRVHFPQQIAAVTRKTLKSSMNSLGSQMESLENEEMLDPWGARVFAENDTHVLINAGMKNGLKKGDLLWISNMSYSWKMPDRPCDSQLHSQRRLYDVERPLAVVKLESIGLDTAEAKVIYQVHNVDIEEGAKAFILELAKPGKSIKTN